MIALLVALQGPPAPPPPPWWGGRVLTMASLHVGVRPALSIDPGEVAIGVTVQISTTLF